ASVGNSHPSDDERESLVRSLPPRPYVGARRHAKGGEGLVVKGRAARQSSTGSIALWHENNPNTAVNADKVSAANAGKELAPAPESRRSGGSTVPVSRGPIRPRAYYPESCI